MNLIRKMNLRKGARYLAIAILLASCPAVMRQAEGQEIQASFRLKITVPDTKRPPFQVPVSGMYALVPAKAEKSVDQSKIRPSYIKIVPQREGASVRIRISALYGKLQTLANNDSIEADRLKDLKQKPVAEFLVAPGDKIIVTQLKSFGIMPIEIEVYSIEIS